MKNKPKLCHKDHNKVSLSESAALRRVQRYAEIERMYFCAFCESYHITKSASGYNNIHDNAPPKKRTLENIVDKQKWIKKRLETLIKRQKQDEK